MSVEPLHTWEANVLASTSITIPVGSIVKDTVLIAILVKTGTTATTSQPSGWTQVHSESFSINHFEVWKKLATSSEPASYTWGGDSQDYILSIHELHRGDFNSVALTAVDSDVDNAPTSPEINNTTVADKSLMLVGFVAGSGAATLNLNTDYIETVNEVLSNIASCTGYRDFDKIYFTEFGTNPFLFAYDNTDGDHKVTDAALTPDGLNLVLGMAEGYPVEGTYNYGKVSSYQRNSLTGNWSETSLPLHGSGAGVSNVGIGASIGLSADGLQLVVGTETRGSRIFVYQRSSVITNWVYKSVIVIYGRNIYDTSVAVPADDDYSFGHELALSEDGLTLTVSMPLKIVEDDETPSYLRAESLTLAGYVLTFTRATVNDAFTQDSNGDYYWDANLRGSGVALYDSELGRYSLGLSKDGKYLLSGGAGGQNTNLKWSLQTLYRPALSSPWVPAQHETFNSNNVRAPEATALTANGLACFKSKATFDSVWWNPSFNLLSRPNHFAPFKQLNRQNSYSHNTGYTAQCIVLSRSGNAMCLGSQDFNASSEFVVRFFANAIPDVPHSIDTSVPWLAYYLTINEESYTQQILDIPAGVVNDNGNILGGSPIAIQDIYKTDHDKTLIVTAPGVMINDEFLS